MLFDVTTDLNASDRSNDLFQALSSLHNRLAREISSTGPKQIEQIVDHRSSRAFLPLLEQLKPGYALVIQRNNLTIQNR